MVLLKKRLIYSTAASVLLHAAVLTGIDLGYTPAVTTPPDPAEPIYVQLTHTPAAAKPENDGSLSPEAENAELPVEETPSNIQENPPPGPVKEIAKADDESTPAPAALGPAPPIMSTPVDEDSDRSTQTHRTDPVPREAIQPDYPLSARIKGYEGAVVIDIRVSASGKVVQTVVTQSSGHEVLDRAAVDSILRTAFMPGMINNNPEDMVVSVKVVFSLQ